MSGRGAFALIALVLLGLGMLAARYYAAVKSEATSSIVDRRLNLAQFAAATLSERLDRVVDLSVSLATRVRFAELVAQGNWDAAAEILRSVPSEFAHVERVFLADGRGTLRADVPALPGVRGQNFAGRDWFQGVSRAWTPYVSAVYRRAAAPRVKVISVATPVHDRRSGKVAGILVVQISLETFFDWASDIGLSNGIALAVADAKGQAGFTSGVSLQGPMVDLSAHPAVQRLREGRAGTALAAAPEGKEHLYAFVPAKHGWGVVVEQPAEAAFAGRDQQLALIQIAYALLVLLLAAMAWLGTRIGKDRLVALARTRRALASHAERLRILREIDRAIAAQESPEAIAAAVIEPLRALLGVPRAIVNRFDLPAGQVEWIAAAGRRRVHVGSGVRYSIRLMGDVEALRRGEVQRLEVKALSHGPEREALLASDIHTYMVVPMIAGGELIGALSFGSRAERFTPGQVSIAQEVATQLAIAISQAHLHERVLRHAEELERRVAERTEALEAAKSELEDLYNNAPCGYHSVDANGLIVRMNDTWLAWLGYAREEVVGKMYHPQLMTPESAARFREEAFPLFKRQGWLKEVEFDYLCKDGGTFPGSLQTSTIYDSEGRYVMSRTTVFDVSERRRMEGELRETNAFLDSVVENIPDMIFVKDAKELRFVRFNRAGEQLLGYARGDLIGKNDYDLFPAGEADFFTANDREVLESGNLLDIEAEQIDTRGNGTRILHTKKLPIHDAGGRPRYLLGISEDITERRQAQEAIRKLNASLALRAQQLEAANKDLESFSYSVSHDLRAPLRAIDGYARMLEEDYGDAVDEEGRRLLATVRGNAAQMARLIDDLLAFSRLGRQPVAAGPVDMTALAREVARELAGEYPQAQAVLAELPPAHGDRALLKQAWVNLIGNALKYSARSAAPRVEIGGRVEADRNQYWVRDNGVGFDMRYAGKLFGVFQRLHRADDFSGTGVGLAIVQRVIARHGGEVRAEAKLGEGACFSFTLPTGATA